MELRSAAFFLLAVAYLMLREERVESARQVVPVVESEQPTLTALRAANDEPSLHD